MNKTTFEVNDRHTFYTVPRKHSGTPLATKQRVTEVTPFQFSDTKSKRCGRFSCESSLNQKKLLFPLVFKPNGDENKLAHSFETNVRGNKSLETYSPVIEVSSPLEASVELSIVPKDMNLGDLGIPNGNETPLLDTVGESSALVANVSREISECHSEGRANIVEGNISVSADEVPIANESRKQFKQRKAHAMYRRIFGHDQ